MELFGEDSTSFKINYDYLTTEYQPAFSFFSRLNYQLAFQTTYINFCPDRKAILFKPLPLQNNRGSPFVVIIVKRQIKIRAGSRL